VRKNLTTWKSQYLSLGRSLTLVNAVLDALPTYMLSLFPIPSSVVQTLDSSGGPSYGKETRKKEFSTKWKDIIRSKKQGGLGIRNLKHQGKALKIKWLWRYAQEPQTLWGSVIKSKYGEEDLPGIQGSHHSIWGQFVEIH